MSVRNAGNEPKAVLSSDVMGSTEDDMSNDSSDCAVCHQPLQVGERVVVAAQIVDDKSEEGPTAVTGAIGTFHEGHWPERSGRWHEHARGVWGESVFTSDSFGQRESPPPIPVIYVGGPRDGETSEEPVQHREGDPPERVYVFGFEEWPMEGGAPTGRYDPDTSEDRVPVQFIWHAYSAEEQAAKWNDPDRPVRMWRATEKYPADE